MFVRMLKLPKETRYRYDVSSLELAVHAAAPCPVAIKEAMTQWWGEVIFEYYDGCEGGWVAINTPEWLQHKGSVSRSDTVHILDDAGQPAALGEVGLVYLESSTPFEYVGELPRRRKPTRPRGDLLLEIWAFSMPTGIFTYATANRT